MGIKIVLTEGQAERLQAKVGKLPINEANLACRYVDYQSLVEFLGDRPSRKIGYETIIHWIGDHEIAVKYHNTDILKMNPSNIVTLNTGGWETNTTKDRLNQFISCRGYRIYQRKNVWYISNNEETVEYQDGMMIHSDGHLSMPTKNVLWKGDVINKIKGIDIDPKYKELYGLSNDEQ